MTLVDVVDLSSDDDDELGKLDVKAVKLEPGLVGSMMQRNENSTIHLVKHQMSKTKSTRQENEDNGSLNASNTGPSSILDQGQSPVEDTGLSSTLSMSPAPVCRQFWKAGNYDDGLGSKVTHQSIPPFTIAFY
ncbi:hypothetical protein TorRG33x02_287380 [Trema orientale]|uniref:Uncharacterized protein n=1 Tax=Trema orientale TaxID=63057 RepID=A0A2P5CF59_TREOI|nr:hypothetical protein TorRG33x02_287380 [Trema orientale]